jgi:anti-sigma factor RsiW
MRVTSLARPMAFGTNMTFTDPSLDARIWAYVRGEGAHAERKQLETDVASDPAAARRYATIKLMHQRELAHQEAPPEKVATHPKAKTASQREVPKKAKPARSSGTMDTVICVLGLLLLGISGGLYLARAGWTPEKLQVARDGVHLGAAVLGGAMALFCKQGRLGVLALATLCIAASCAVAAMLVV